MQRMGLEPIEWFLGSAESASSNNWTDSWIAGRWVDTWPTKWIWLSLSFKIIQKTPKTSCYKKLYSRTCIPQLHINHLLCDHSGQCKMYVHGDRVRICAHFSNVDSRSFETYYSIQLCIGHVSKSLHKCLNGQKLLSVYGQTSDITL